MSEGLGHDREIAGLALRLRKAYARRASGASLVATVAFVMLVAFGAVFVARMGTPAARAGAAAAIAAAVLLAVALAIFRRLRWTDARRAVHLSVQEIDPPLAGAIQRAARLTDRSVKESVDAAMPVEARQLAELHLHRQLARVSVERAADRAERTGKKLALAGLGFAAVSMGFVAVEPMRIVEGADVLAARHGVAPFGLVYLDEVDVVATRPPYLQMGAEEVDDFDSTRQPRGTIIAVRGKPSRAGRKLVLTDGVDETPFVDDGSGVVVARWTLGETTHVHVAARFGDVVIPQRDTLDITSIPDLAPKVSLEGAPKTVKLIDTPSVALRYEATDDHGLKEVALVLRAGAKEERRTLSRPGSDTKTERGGQELSTREPFFQKSYIPIQVTIEARDNDAVLGPKWGKSDAIIVMPPQVGEPEALRYAALLRIRDAVVDLTAPRVERGTPKPNEMQALVKAEVAAQKETTDAIEKLIADSYGGLTIRGRVRKVIAGQLRALGIGLDKLQKTPSADGYAELVKTSEDVVLAIDVAIKSQGFVDSAKVSKRLADVADEVALASHLWTEKPDERANAEAEVGVAIDVLRGGGLELVKMGDLGVDLGDLVRGGVGRIERPRSQKDFVTAEIAARDLAERLRHPEASLAGGGRPGVESGGAPSSGGSAADGEDASDADEEAQQSGKELDELIQQHADEMGKVAEAMKKATTDEERDALKKLAKEQADAIREAVKGFPTQGVPGMPSEKLAEGRKHAESMAGALEQGDVDEALKSGDDALKALREAAKRSTESPFSDDQEAAKDATRAGNRVEEGLDAMRDALKKMQDAASERAKDDLKGAGEDEKRIGERTRDLRKRGDEGKGSMPEETLQKLGEAEDAMKEAEEALKQGDGERGASKQRDAQRLLEMSKGDENDKEDNDGKEPNGDQDGDGKRFSQKIPVPGKDKHKGPDDFRKRVTEGLGQSPDPRLRDAIRRYAEGLLR